jgi:multidrug efflux pump subunit AcrA (membrane-fusion protein)
MLAAVARIVVLLALVVGVTARAEPPADPAPPLRLHGSVEPVRSHAIVVPRLSGSGTGALVIVRLVKPGTPVKRGDLLIEFDRQAQIKTAHDREAEYRDFIEQINRRRGEQLTLGAHDEAELMTAENAVKSADLDRARHPFGVAPGR